MGYELILMAEPLFHRLEKSETPSAEAWHHARNPSIQSWWTTRAGGQTHDQPARTLFRTLPRMIKEAALTHWKATTRFPARFGAVAKWLRQRIANPSPWVQLPPAPFFVFHENPRFLRRIEGVFVFGPNLPRWSSRQVESADFGKACATFCATEIRCVVSRTRGSHCL